MSSRAHKSLKNWEPDILHMVREIQKLRESGNYDGVSLEEEYADFLKYIERLRTSGKIDQLEKAEEFLKEHYEPLLRLKSTKK